MSLVARCCIFGLGLLSNYVFLQASYDLYKVEVKCLHIQKILGHSGGGYVQYLHA